MKKLLKLALCAACVTGLVACEKKGGSEVISEKEQALQRVMTPYVDHTVVATYSSMADEGLTLVSQCRQILTAIDSARDYSSTLASAGETWRAMRKHWEQSEAFLYGPAAAHNIDPHIDSWPLDFNSMNAMLHNEEQMKQIEEEGGAYVGEKLGYALKGFHACEYLLFESVIKDGRAVGTGKTHPANLTHAEAVYLLGIVEDLAQQAILLEYCWAGEVSEKKQAVLDEAEVETFEDRYGHQMINAGKAGSIYVSYQEAAEEIIAGCVDIAGEVAELKMGNPYISSTPDERDYIESPYSCTSTIDFADNIRSIQHAYCGAQSGDACISDYVKSVDKDVDAQVRTAIDEAIKAIEQIEDFENTAKENPLVKNAIDKVQELEEVLDNEVMALLAK